MVAPLIWAGCVAQNQPNQIRSHQPRKCAKDLLRYRADPDWQVAEAALLALGALGDRSVKAALESRLGNAPPSALPGLVDAVLGVADEDSAVLLGRLAMRSADPALRRVIAGALGSLEGERAAIWLRRLAEDVDQEVRQTAEAALLARA